MIRDEADEVLKELYDLLQKKYQHNLESMKNSDFVFDYVDSPDWIKNKKSNNKLHQ